eukprot:1158689-Pelagomonas_calceolata.AAC.19
MDSRENGLRRARSHLFCNCLRQETPNAQAVKVACKHAPGGTWSSPSIKTWSSGCRHCFSFLGQALVKWAFLASQSIWWPECILNNTSKGGALARLSYKACQKEG